jgi:hypothetical protein
VLKSLIGGDEMDARISMINYEDSEGELRELYERFNGKMANILKVHSLNPKSLSAHLDYYKVIMYGKSPAAGIELEPKWLKA